MSAVSRGLASARGRSGNTAPAASLLGPFGASFLGAGVSSFRACRRLDPGVVAASDSEAEVCTTPPVAEAGGSWADDVGAEDGCAVPELGDERETVAGASGPGSGLGDDGPVGPGSGPL